MGSVQSEKGPPGERSQGLPTVSVVVPVYGEGEAPGRMIRALRTSPQVLEVVVVGAVGDPQPCPWTDVWSPRGRAVQLNHGAARARGDAILFLHSDSVVDEAGILEFRSNVARHPLHAFAFALEYEERDWRLAILGITGRWLSRWGRYALGDQGFGLSRRTFEAAGGYPEVDVLEDWKMVRCFRAENRFHVLQSRCRTSGRRFLARGVLRQLLGNIRLLMEYADGADPASLARDYERTEVRS